MKIANLFGLAALAAAKPTVYFIRHGEKPDDGNGLSTQGEERAQCLRSVFGASSGYNIGHIMAQAYKSSESPLPSPKCHVLVLSNRIFSVLVDGKRQRPYLTVLPLAQDLGLTVDVSCDRDDEDCVVDVVESYDGDGNILIW